MGRRQRTVIIIEENIQSNNDAPMEGESATDPDLELIARYKDGSYTQEQIESAVDAFIATLP